MNIDRQFYTVISSTVVHERRLSDIGDRAQTIRDIRTGQIEDVQRVIEYQPVEDWSRDVSEDFAREIAAQIEPGDKVSDDLREFIESHCGVNTVLRAAA